MRTDGAADNIDPSLVECQGNQRNEDPLRNISDFLNQFQSHFLPPNDGEVACGSTDSSVKNITTRDLEDVFTFRSLIEEHEIKEGEKFIADEYGRSEMQLEPLTRRISDSKNEELENIKKKIQSTSRRTKLVFSMLRRCEVWTCKLVAQDHLMTPIRLLPETARSKTDQCCFSPFINLPCSKYFSKLLPSMVTDKEQLVESTEATAAKDNSTPSRSSIPAFHRQNKFVTCCTLALPPNKNTWQAYARLAIMTSFIGGDEVSGCDSNHSNQKDATSYKKNDKELSMIQCLKSPSCAYDLNKYKKGRLPSQTYQYSFSPSLDLVPLWVRAQRNTQALRQMIFLFEVVRKRRRPDNGLLEPSADVNNTTHAAHEIFRDPLERGKDLGDIDAENGGDTIEEDAVNFKVLFRGNPTNIRTRVMEINEHVDRLIEWAVVNQSIFTYSRIKNQILSAPLNRQRQKHARKRQREIDAFSYSANISKKVYRGINDKEDLFELRQACQSYLLRWFARRNRKALTIIFSNRTESLSLDIGCRMNKRVLSQTEKLRHAQVPSKIQQLMQNERTGGFYPEDRTLSRIDRRLFIEGRYSSTGPITCRSQVSNLLTMFSAACPGSMKSHKRLVDAAIEDLEHLFHTFYPTDIDEGDKDAVYNIALNLVQPSTGCTESSLIDLFKSAPAPWVEKCCRCNKSEPPTLLTCFNCEQVFHQKCSSSSSGSSYTTASLKDYIISFPPLRDIFKLKHPKNLTYPDFSTLENQWTKKTIQIERQIKDDGKVRKLGISFDHTEECSKALEAIESDAFSLMELMQSEENKIQGDNVLTAARITHKGCLIREVHNNLCGGRAGLQIGDIIIGVELVEYADTKDEQKYGGPSKFDMSDLSSNDRLSILKVETLRLNLIILRPQTNIVEIANTWLTALKRTNKTILEVIRGINTLRPWYCGACSQPRTSVEKQPVFLEAAYCRAVIRRIGMESYSKPFQEGEQRPQTEYFCLRRLDSIMTHIMRVESNSSLYGYAPESFFVPSCADSTPQRLTWATDALESRPMELLCTAMKVLVNAPFSGQKQLNSQRIALLRHFLLTFSSWCVGATVKSSSYSRLVGPPEVFQYSRPPWFGGPYTIRSFQSSKTENTYNDQLRLNEEPQVEDQIGNVDSTEAEKIGHEMKEYSTHASLVGKLFLVLPSDPLVEYVSRIVRIEHENRPVEFIVASYLPPHFHDVVVNGRQGRKKNQYDQFTKKDGIYHLLPVVSSRQQIYLLERCKMRNQHGRNNSDDFWTSLDVLNLDGVVRYSPTALQRKMEESSRIRLAIDHAILERVCKSSSILPSSSFLSSSHYNTTMMKLSSAAEDFSLKIQNKLLDTLLNGKASAETVRQLLDNDSNQNENGAAEDDEDSSKWKIIQRGEKEDSLEFGLSRLQQGLISVNPVRTLWKILMLQHISEEKYSLYYSDFLFQDEVGKQDLQKKLYPLNISPYQGSRLPRNEAKKIITLSQLNTNTVGSNLFGWGFEILKWANERVLRVGRVRRESPAFRAGLKTHDIVESVNGIRFTQFRDISSLISSILGASSLKIRIPGNLTRKDEISVLLSTIKGSKIKLTPVTFCIFRPLSIDNGYVRSQIPVPRLESHTQDRRQYHRTPRKNSELNDNVSQATPLPLHPQVISRSMNSMIRVLQETYSLRPTVAKWDFFSPAKNGTILTTLEVSVFLESLLHQTWKLGIRLLMPRYEIETVAKQVKIIFSWTREILIQIPVLTGDLYQNILDLDWGRMQCKKYPETGPIILEEEKNGVYYKYRSPRRPLPIDRSIEIEFDKSQKKHQQKKMNPHYQQPRRQNSTSNHNTWLLQQNNYYYPRSSGGYENHFLPQQQRRSQDHCSAFSSITRIQDNRNGSLLYDKEIQSNKALVDLADEDGGFPGVDEPTLLTDEPSLQIYINETNDRRDNSNTDHSNVVHSRSSFTSSAERIRGGGYCDAEEVNHSCNDDEGSYLCLCDVPRSQWKGKAVYTYVQTARQGSLCSDALLVGIVRRFIEANDCDDEIPDKVEIESYYLSPGTGYLERTKIHESYSDDVWVVNINQDCEQARVIAKLLSQNKLPSDYQEEFQLATLKGTHTQNECELSKIRNSLCEKDKEDDERARSEPSTPIHQHGRAGTKCSTATCCVDTLHLEFGQTPYTYSCEEQHLGVKSSIKNLSVNSECSLCSLPFERCFTCKVSEENEKNCSKSTFSRSLGCSLMSDIALAEHSSQGNIPGRIGEGKNLLLKIAKLIPASLRLTTKDSRQQIDPLQSYRIFDNDANYAIWKAFVAECTCTEMLAQALVTLLSSIQRTRLPSWWSQRNTGWSTPYAIMSESSLSALYLHIYVLDAALSDIICRSLKQKSQSSHKSGDAHAIQNQRMKKYWERAIALGYKAFQGSHRDKCYHCHDGGHLLCCDLCPNVQHPECCDPKLDSSVSLEHWLCDSCVNDIENYEEEDEFEEYQDEV